MSNVKKTSGGLIGYHHILSLLVSHEKKSKDVIVSLRSGDEDAFVVGIRMVDGEEETITFVYAGAVHEIFVAALNSAWNVSDYFSFVYSAPADKTILPTHLGPQTQ